MNFVFAKCVLLSCFSPQLVYKTQIVLTDRSKHIRNKAIRKCDRLELDGMYTFIEPSGFLPAFVSIDKAKAVVEWSPFSGYSR